MASFACALLLLVGMRQLRRLRVLVPRCWLTSATARTGWTSSADVRTDSPEYRSWVMSRVRSKDTAPERRVRSLMHRAGYRYRLHVKDLPGKPDIVLLPRYKTVVFVHGCFWHRHRDCPKASMPQSNGEYWSRKFTNNVARDAEAQDARGRAGWRVLVIWEVSDEERPRLGDVHRLSIYA